MVVSPDLLTSIAIGAVALYTLVTAAGHAIDRLLALARHYGVSDALIGLTVIAVGTSLPEIGSHVVASLGILSGALDYRVASAVVIGGNMGSSTVQQTLLVGLLLVGYGRIQLTDSFVRTSYAPMVLALLLTLVVAWDGTVSRLDGLALLVGYLAYTYYGYSRRQRDPAVGGTPSTNVARDAAVAVAALALVVASASLLLTVVGTVVASLALGGSMVGVVTLGVAAALPELSTVLDAVRRRTPNVALGTLVGSNVVNPLLGIGLGGSISTYYVPRSVVLWDLPFKLAVAVGLLGYVTYASDRALTRREGAYLVVLYLVYVSVRLLLFPTG